MTASLYQLTLDSQSVDGALALALDKAGSDDPEQQAEAEQLITELLQKANANQSLLKDKANAICHVYEMLRGKAEFLRKSAAERLAKADAEDRAAQRLLDYLTRCLTALHPGQKSFPLPEYTIASRSSEVVETDDVLLPVSCKRFEIKVKLASGNAEAADQLLAVINETVRDLFELSSDQFEINVTTAPDKAAIKAHIKSGDLIAGARITKKTNWSIK